MLLVNLSRGRKCIKNRFVFSIWNIGILIDNTGNRVALFPPHGVTGSSSTSNCFYFPQKCNILWQPQKIGNDIILIVHVTLFYAGVAGYYFSWRIYVALSIIPTILPIFWCDNLETLDFKRRQCIFSNPWMRMILCLITQLFRFILSKNNTNHDFISLLEVISLWILQLCYYKCYIVSFLAKNENISNIYRLFLISSHNKIILIMTWESTFRWRNEPFLFNFDINQYISIIWVEGRG